MHEPKAKYYHHCASCLNSGSYKTKYHKIDGFLLQKVILHSSVNCKPRSGGQHGDVLVRALFFIGDNQPLIFSHGRKIAS